MHLEMLGEAGTAASIIDDFLSKIPSSSSEEWDWNNFSNQIINVVGKVGLSAIDTLLAQPMDAETRAQMVTLVKGMQDRGEIPKTNFTPWIIGGSVVAGLLILALVLKR